MEYGETAGFSLDRRLVALPMNQEESADPVTVFKKWLARMLILRPIPPLILGTSNGPSMEPRPQLEDFGAWFAGLMAGTPAAYSIVDQYLKQLMPEFQSINNPLTGPEARRLVVEFSDGKAGIVRPFADLSDGEKCFTICGLVLATRSANSSLFCFWDEPDNYLALSEVGHFVMALRRAFQDGGQFIATSHNPEAIRCFSDENTYVVHRRSQLEPTVLRPLSELRKNGSFSGDLVGALIRGDVEV